MAEKTIALGWLLVGAMAVLLLQAQTEPRRKNRKTEPEQRDNGKVLHPDLSQSLQDLKHAAGK